MPDQPTTPVTTRVGDTIEIDWSVAYSGSTPISSYTIQFLTVDGTTFAEESTNCDGNNAQVISDSKCVVPSQTFTQLPF